MIDYNALVRGANLSIRVVSKRLIEDIAELDERYTLKYIEDTGNDVISSGLAGRLLIHQL